MNCPACEKKVKVLPDKPSMNYASTVTTTVDFGTDGDASGIAFGVDTITKETYKCCNESCWVTRVEVDWGQS